MINFYNLPCDIYHLISLQCDSFSQVVSLAATARRIRHYYFKRIHSILYPIARRNIVCFEDAFLTVRATEEVITHYRNGNLPPSPFPLHSLSEPRTGPVALQDIKTILNWEHMLGCVEDALMYDGLMYHSGLITKYPETDWTTWRRNFRRSIYRLFLIGAVLCRTYQEPLQSSRPDVPPGFLADCAYRLVKYGAYALHQDEIRHLLAYSAFDRDAPCKSHGPDLKALADFLVERARSRAQRETLGLPMYPPTARLKGIDPQTASILYAETMQCLVTYGLVVGGSGLFRRPKVIPATARKVTAVFMDWFLPEEIFLSLPHHNHQELPAGLGAGWGVPSRFLEDLLDCVHKSLRSPSTHGINPPLQIFRYIRHKFLRLGFSDDAAFRFTWIPVSDPESMSTIYADEWSHGMEELGY